MFQFCGKSESIISIISNGCVDIDYINKNDFTKSSEIYIGYDSKLNIDDIKILIRRQKIRILKNKINKAS